MSIPHEIITHILSYSPDKRFYLLNKKINELYFNVEKDIASKIRKRYHKFEEIVNIKNHNLIDITIRHSYLWKPTQNDYLRIAIHAVKHNNLDLIKWSINHLMKKRFVSDEMSLIFCEAMTDSSFYTIKQLVQTYKCFETKYYHMMILEEGIKRQDYDMIEFGLSHKNVEYNVNEIASQAIVFGSLDVYDYTIKKGATNFQKHAERVVIYSENYCKKLSYIMTKGNVDIPLIVKHCLTYKQEYKAKKINDFFIKK
jgi:hypothetical protein